MPKLGYAQVCDEDGRIEYEEGKFATEEELHLMHVAWTLFNGLRFIDRERKG